MNKEEYITTLAINGKCVPVGLNDAGQTYFFEYIDDSGTLVEECCGSYNTDYKSYIEYKFGEPEKNCEHYESMELFHEDENCPNKFKYGYCDKCKFQDINWSNFKSLVDLEIIDRRGNINKKYEQFLQSKLIENIEKKEN